MVITALARAKINLTLDVLGKRPDGYHEVEMVMQSIELHDRLEFRPCAAGGISLAVEGADLPPGKENLVYRAAELLRAAGGVRAGAEIRLKKAIPVAAGLGGGSADAAAALVALNEMWNTGFSPAGLMELAEQLGSDVPFGLMGGTALARGRGERLERLFPCPPLGLVLVKPPFGVSTAEVYRAFKPGLNPKKADAQAMVRAIKKGDAADIAACLGNALEPVTVKMYPEVAEIKKKLMEAGALGALMAGSGPTVFGLTADLESARQVAARYRRTDEQILVTRTFNPRL
ncbi:4-diphosphocytidyl-2C-methyl-D-erythritol 2-phosphate synthase [Pelotomaculum thermopropionicum SI]|uniref:4-diphosphocytidyl-2-C-methyl-D-erythritol kinase n=1 Tax=Pelotomaculum thermopropionicum (strain DSM 13744 / JCM 10971 / SI) TaxID=370438 RepID=ISPE_PELTS|nr:RecName: Full=4-diphosphocytidyl-2-C-methyl-D-erythritol kinase; Short=CMK; AltName: Full=4-(cytidine-5'-diphospho)-2-C-methyl-D-erythritol kinase [Pelotomaculum thermopropionicum SI]BAF58277.1 4-diphosphocytidyl-2C-methyl-D-erythritol 2-phosphate synthase [Pelotomaculum thermopropionicum SI]